MPQVPTGLPRRGHRISGVGQRSCPRRHIASLWMVVDDGTIITRAASTDKMISFEHSQIEDVMRCGVRCSVNNACGMLQWQGNSARVKNRPTFSKQEDENNRATALGPLISPFQSNTVDLRRSEMSFVTRPSQLGK